MRSTFFFFDQIMLNERFYSIREKYIKFNNKFSWHLIYCNYAQKKKSLRLIFYDMYLKENKIENLQWYIEDEKNKNKILRSFINNFKTLKKNIQYTTKIVTVENIQKYNKMYDENSTLTEISFKNNINHVVQFTQFQIQFTTRFLIIKKQSKYKSRVVQKEYFTNEK